jgi:hypothetical protein
MWGGAGIGASRSGIESGARLSRNIVHSAYVEIIRTSLTGSPNDPYPSNRAGGMPLRRGTALTLVGLLIALLAAVALQFVLNR